MLESKELSYQQFSEKDCLKNLNSQKMNEMDGLTLFLMDSL